MNFVYEKSPLGHPYWTPTKPQPVPDESPWQRDLSWERAQNRRSAATPATPPVRGFESVVERLMLSGNTRAQCDPASCDFDAPTLDASCNACMLTLLNTSTSSGSSVADLRRVAQKTDARAMATWGTFTVCSNVAAWYIATAQRANPSAAVALVSQVAMLGFPLSDGSSCEGGCREFHRPVLPATCQSIQKKTVFRYGLSLFCYITRDCAKVDPCAEVGVQGGALRGG